MEEFTLGVYFLMNITGIVSQKTSWFKIAPRTSNTVRKQRGGGITSDPTVPQFVSLTIWIFDGSDAYAKRLSESSSLSNPMTLEVFSHESKSKRTRLRFLFWFEAKERQSSVPDTGDGSYLVGGWEAGDQSTSDEPWGHHIFFPQKENAQRREDRVRGFTPRNQPSASEQKILQRHLEMLTERLTSLTSSTSTHKLSWVSTP